MTHILTQQTDTFEFPPLGAVKAKRGYVDEMVTLVSTAVDSQHEDDTRPVQVSITRAADNAPLFDVPLLDYRIDITIGEETTRGFDDVIALDLEQAERFVSLLAAAVERGKADLVNNADFFGAVAS